MSLFDQALGAEYARNNYNKQAHKANKQINKTINQYDNRERQYQDVTNRQQATAQRYIAAAKQEKADLEHRVLGLNMEIEEYQELHAQNKVLYSKLYNKYNEQLELDKQLAVKAQSIEGENRTLNAKLLNTLEANSELQQPINHIQGEYQAPLPEIEVLEQQLTGGHDE